MKISIYSYKLVAITGHEVTKIAVILKRFSNKNPTQKPRSWTEFLY